jgi:phage terminase large subunit
LPFYINWLHDFRSKNGIVFGNHYAPHDIEKRELSNNRSIKQTALSLGIRFITIPRIQFKPDAIEAARGIFKTCWFHETNCEHGLAALREYHAKWNEKGETFGGSVENWATHGADSFLQFAQKDRIGLDATTKLIQHNRVNQRSVFDN